MSNDIASNAVIHIIDPCHETCDELIGVLTSAGLEAVTYSNARIFLDSCKTELPGCVITEIQLPDMSGLELQERLREPIFALPIIFLTAQGNLATAVLAMKRGAIDFLCKPISREPLLDSVKAALARDAKNRSQFKRYSEAECRLSKLTPRERQVLKLLLDGKSNKIVAAELGLSYKTVEFHRSRIMAKSRSDSLADLVKMSLVATELQPI